MSQLRIHLQSLPPYTPPGATLFLAGDFNDWEPADERYRFLPQGDGSCVLDLEVQAPVVECKITRGNWSSAEGDVAGQISPNRVIRVGAGEKALWFGVQSWTDLATAASCHTASPNVVLLHPNFPLPQLGRERRVWAYLPPDYWTSQRAYPVIYMQDGQNLFDACDTLSGEWGVDKALNRLFHRQADHPSTASALSPVIVIGVEHGSEHRIAEYSPWSNAEYGGGAGAAYLEFLCHTLKPYVDQHFRTLPDRANTGIIGSSMGGLMALYAVLARADVFGMAGVFSPSLWFSPEILPFVRHRPVTLPTRILLMAGQRESSAMVSDLLDLYETLLETGHADENLHYDLHADGGHAEWFWAREFEHAFSWLLGAPAEHDGHGTSSDSFRFQLDKSARELVLNVHPRLVEPALEVRDYCHDRNWRHPLVSGDNRIPYAVWEECLYSLRIHTAGDLVFSRRVHLHQLEKTAS